MGDRISVGGGAVVRLARAPEAVGWDGRPTARGFALGGSPPSTIEKRAASLYTTSFGAGASGTPTSMKDPSRILDSEQLFRLYKQVPEIRNAVESIVRRVSTWDWVVKPRTKAADGPKHRKALEAAEAVKLWLEAPDADGTTWQELVEGFVRDVLVFDVGAFEMVFSATTTEQRGEPPRNTVVPAPGAKLRALALLLGPSLYAFDGTDGRLAGYEQSPFEMQQLGKVVTKAPTLGREIVAFFSGTTTSCGRTLPIIETIILEALTLLKAAEHLLLAYDANEIPPGILTMWGITGAAAVSAKEDLITNKAKDHRIRVVQNPQPSGTPPTWTEFRHTPKDLAMETLVKELRRLIWRAFGVLPVEMGATEDVPRAVGEVQMDAGTSHLVAPLLKKIQARINASVIPALLGKAAPLVRFEFDQEQALTPKEQKDKADALTAKIKAGVMTRNEARAEDDLDPIEGGDVATVEVSGGGLVTVASLLHLDDETEEEEMPTPTGGGSNNAGGTTPGAADDAEEEAPAGSAAEVEDVEDDAEDAMEGDAAAGNPAEEEEDDDEDDRAHAHDHIHERASIDAGVGWPKSAAFKGLRVLPLDAVAEQVVTYTADVAPLWVDAASAAVGAVRAAWDGTDAGAAKGLEGVTRSLDILATSWGLRTGPRYTKVAELCRNAAADDLGVPVLEDWQARADLFQHQEMAYLVAPRGLLDDVRVRVATTLAAAVAASRSLPGEVTDTRASGFAGMSPAEIAAAVTAGVQAAFDGNAHRVNNYAGALVELANNIFRDGLTSVDPPGGWKVEWVAVLDEGTCTTCSTEAALGIRDASTLKRAPGRDTECRRNDRCVLVWWTGEQVSDGTAFPMSGKV